MTNFPTDDGDEEVQRIEGSLKLVIQENGQPDFELPEGYQSITGSVSVMTPYATDIVHSKEMGSIAPFSRTWTTVARHYGWPDEMKYTEERHPELAPDKLRVKEWNGEERIFEIVVEDRREEVSADA